MSKSQLIINEGCLEKMIEAYHVNQGHLGMYRVIHIIRSKFHCFKLVYLVRKYINKCKVCLARKSVFVNIELYLMKDQYVIVMFVCFIIHITILVLKK